MRKEIIAIPMGDPAGVGPEIVVKALSSHLIGDGIASLVIGDRKILEDAMRFSRASCDRIAATPARYILRLTF